MYNNMKVLKMMGLGLLMLGASQMISCSKSNSDSPVDQYIEILENATKQAEKISSLQELNEVQSVVTREEAQTLLMSAKDYELSDSEKSKLKKATDKFLKVAFEKSMEYSNLPEDIKKESKAQVDLAIEAVNKHIDNAKTLGEISGVR